MFSVPLEKIKKDVPLQKISENGFNTETGLKKTSIITFYEKNC